MNLSRYREPDIFGAGFLEDASSRPSLNEVSWLLAELFDDLVVTLAAVEDLSAVIKQDRVSLSRLTALVALIDLVGSLGHSVPPVG